MLVLQPPVQSCKAGGCLVQRSLSLSNQEPGVQLPGCAEGLAKSPEHLQGPQRGLTAVVPQTASGAARAASLAGRCSAAIRVLSAVIYLALLTTLLFPSLLTSGHMCL